MTRKTHELMAQLLNEQAETLEQEELKAFEARLADYAAGGQALPPEDVAMIWSSPTARRIYLRHRNAGLAELERRWQDRGLGREFFRRAADTGEAESLTMNEAGVSIRIVRSDSGDWLINVAFSPDAAALLPPDAKIRLVDSGGTEWLNGRPDRAGGIDAFWADDDQTPIDRLKSHSLHLHFF